MVLLAPVLLGLTDVGLVAELGHALGLGEEFLGLVGISLLDAEVADLAAPSLEGLCVVGAHGNLSDIDVAVGGSNHTQILLADALALSSENRE